MPFPSLPRPLLPAAIPVRDRAAEASYLILARRILDRAEAIRREREKQKRQER